MSNAVCAPKPSKQINEKVNDLLLEVHLKSLFEYPKISVLRVFKYRLDDHLVGVL